ncbi:hypothetical protein OU995_21435 [Roseateles sp. SL47]|uniref:hypothetical protein n=1 Tax=Roseateles sp. SL47 TaxID=2995138 RepID=UPI00226FA234|nr:hypothetical protein [Roseateles sp. SL47]WAC72107.1 hypothetical protein OU995_21435 [Roseateles sp. SL47]
MNAQASTDPQVVVSTAPACIYLLVSDDPEHRGKPFPKNPDGDEVTWCPEPVLECNVAYLRADVATQEAQALRRLLQSRDSVIVDVAKQRDTWAAAARSIKFQERVAPWMEACFGREISGDTEERNHRFLEEALELVQACGCTQIEAHQLVDYVYGRPSGDKAQEVGGVMVTLAALCLAQAIDMHLAGDVELARIWGKVHAIRAKQAAKPKHSPLPDPSGTEDSHVR